MATRSETKPTKPTKQNIMNFQFKCPPFQFVVSTESSKFQFYKLSKAFSQRQEIDHFRVPICDAKCSKFQNNFHRPARYFVLRLNDIQYHISVPSEVIHFPRWRIAHTERKKNSNRNPIISASEPPWYTQMASFSVQLFNCQIALNILYLLPPAAEIDRRRCPPAIISSVDRKDE